MRHRGKFLAPFLFFAFVAKIIGECVHEVLGHGFFVLLFGGSITRVHISLLWPYELSFIQSTGNFTAWQRAWILGGGILACYVVSFVLQGVLLLRLIRDQRLSAALFWLAFWTFLSSTGYLIVGGIRPFGDVAVLIADGVLSSETALLLGMIVFLEALFVMSKILTDMFIKTKIIKDLNELRISLALFWLIIPLITAIYCLGRGHPLYYLQIFTLVSFAPVVVAPIIPSILSYHFDEDKSNNARNQRQ